MLSFHEIDEAVCCKPPQFSVLKNLAESSSYTDLAKVIVRKNVDDVVLCCLAQAG